jgi:type VI secretion system protein ImpC
MAGLKFEFDLAPRRRVQRMLDEDAPFRILVVGDFAGAATRAPLEQRKALAIDIDNLDTRFARIAPKLAFDLAGESIEIDFDSLEDFHPDRLFSRQPFFEPVRRLQGGLRDLRHRSKTDVQRTDADSDIERLLGRKPQAARNAFGPGMQAWLRELVAPHVVPAPGAEQELLAREADAVAGTMMRALLHLPAFQTLEANWRGLESLVRTCSDERVSIHVLDVSEEELVGDVEAAASGLRSTLVEQICGAPEAGADAAPWSLLVFNGRFDADDASLQRLAVLGALAQRAGAPLIAEGAVALLGARRSQLAEPADWVPADSDTLAGWQALRRSAQAAWIGLVLPRVIARLPYGAATDAIASFPFEEMATPPDHDDYLWSSPAYALAQLLVRAFESDGWQMEPAAYLDIDDLPSHCFKRDGEVVQQPCAEVLFGEAAGEAMLGRGLMPLMSYRNRNAVRLLRWQSIADPPATLHAPWTK